MKITTLDNIWYSFNTLSRLQDIRILQNTVVESDHRTISRTLINIHWYWRLLYKDITLSLFVSVQTQEKEDVKRRQNIWPYHGGSIYQLWWMVVSGFSRLLARALHLLEGRGSPRWHIFTPRFLDRISFMILYRIYFKYKI